MPTDSLDWRGFLKLAALGLSGLAIRSRIRRLIPDFPINGFLGRVNAGKVEIRSQPDVDSPATGVLYEDSIVAWLREVVGWNPYRIN